MKNLTHLFVASDHRGRALKDDLMTREPALPWHDLDTWTPGARIDYPDVVPAVIQGMDAHPHTSRGLLICGSGVGMCIAANRFVGIQSMVAHSPLEVMKARQHNDINVLCLGAELTSASISHQCLLSFLTTAFKGGRYGARLDAINQLGR